MNFNLALPLPANWHSINCLVKNWKCCQEHMRHAYEMFSSMLRWVTGNYWGFSLCFLFLVLYFMSMSWLAKLDFYWFFNTLVLVKKLGLSVCVSVYAMAFHAVIWTFHKWETWCSERLSKLIRVTESYNQSSNSATY